MSGTYPVELGRLVGAMCDGAVSADDTEQLDLLLERNEEARRFYNNYMFLHAELYTQHVSLEVVESEEDLELRIAYCESERAGSSPTICRMASYRGRAVGCGGRGLPRSETPDRRRFTIPLQNSPATTGDRGPRAR